MERWAGKVAVVTGAGSGMGRATSELLVKSGLKVAGFGRRLAKLQEVEKHAKGPGKFYPVQCDVSKEKDVIAAFSWVKSNLGGVDILINNAGTMNNNNLSLSAGPVESLQGVICTNVFGPINCTKEAIQSMNERGCHGHIVFLNSIAGHYVPKGDWPFNTYPASKHAITGLVETLRQELAAKKSKIRVTSISPGMVRSNLYDEQNEPNKILRAVELQLEPVDIANGIIFALSAPPHVNVAELTIRPTGELF